MRTVPASFRIGRDSRAAAVFVAAGVVLTGIYFALPRGGAASSVVYEGLGASASLALLWGVRRFGPLAAAVAPVQRR